MAAILFPVCVEYMHNYYLENRLDPQVKFHKEAVQWQPHPLLQCVCVSIP